MECAKQTAWDTVEGALGATGASLHSVSSLEAEDCGAPAKPRFLVTTSVMTPDLAAAQAANVTLGGVVASSKRAKLSIQVVSHKPGDPLHYQVEAREKVRMAATGEAPTAQIAGAFVNANAGALVPVCGRSLTIERWVLEETEPLTEKASRPRPATRDIDRVRLGVRACAHPIPSHGAHCQLSRSAP